MTEAQELYAPAKINLGLEILGRRSDGFHEVRSVLAKVTLFDFLTVSTSGTDSFREDPSFSPEPEQNLVVRARDLYRETSGFNHPLDISLSKHIPMAAGLGGASSDAAEMLRAMQNLHHRQLPLDDLAAQLGSDVPFFLGPSVASVRGRGTESQPLPDLQGSLVLIAPNIQIPAKTKTLYASLVATDFTSGERIDDLEHVIRSGGSLTEYPHLLSNAFERALTELSPESASLGQALEEAGIRSHLTGAGPSRYVLCDSENEATQIKRTIEKSVAADTRVFALRFLPTSPN